MKKMLISAGLAAGMAAGAVQLKVTPNRPSALYEVGEEAELRIECFDDTGEKVDSGAVLITLRDNAQNPIRFKLDLAGECTVKITGQMPGFTAVIAEVGNVKASAGVGFSPERIGRTIGEEPADFDEFWQRERENLRKLPLDAQIDPAPEFSNDVCNAYRISFAGYNNSRIYGFMTVPKAEGKYPIYFTVPGAGPISTHPVNVYNAEAITIGMNVFPFPLPPDSGEAARLVNEAFPAERQYWTAYGTDFEGFFFSRAYLSIDRVVDWAAALPEFDGEHLVYWGSSQGGAMGHMLAAFNKNITAMALNVPSNFDKILYRPYIADGSHPEQLKLLPYFNGRNFAKRITIPYMVSAGMVDLTCPASAVAEIFNASPSRDKLMYPVPGMGHSFDPAYDKMTDDFVRKHLHGKK